MARRLAVAILAMAVFAPASYASQPVVKRWVIPTNVSGYFLMGAKITLNAGGFDFTPAAYGDCNSHSGQTEVRCTIFDGRGREVALIGLIRTSRCGYLETAAALGGTLKTKHFNLCTQTPAQAFLH